MTTLKEQALKAEARQREDYRQSRERDREKSLSEIRGEWEKRWERTFRGTKAPESPEMTWAKVTTDESRHPQATGWRFTIDDVEFLICVDYQHRGSFYAILTCPDCGCEYGTVFHGMEQLGKLLRTQRSIMHTCYESALLGLASAIKNAARETKLTTSEVIDRAVERHSDIIYRR